MARWFLPVLLLVNKNRQSVFFLRNDDVESVNLTLANITMTTNTNVYGAGMALEDMPSDMEVDSVVVNLFGTMTNGKAGKVFAGGLADDMMISASTVSLNVNVEGKVGILFAGTELVKDGEFEAEVGTTTIDGGIFLGYVGNGCYRTDGSASEYMTTEIGTASLIINDGTFNNLVYAGGFADGDDIMVGQANLTINGGYFKNLVCGGNGGLNATCTTDDMSVIEGDVSVRINASTNSPIHFEHSLLSGSVGDGQIGGSTTMTFTGSGAGLSFAESAYISGGSQLAWHKMDEVEDYVGGTTSLVFEEFKGAFNANMRNGFTNVEFKNSEVSFKESGIEVDLTYVNTWAFDVSDSTIDLVWEKGTNDFDGDTILVNGWDGATSKILMTGSEDTLKNWNCAVVEFDNDLLSGHLECDKNNLMIVADVA